jgi:predicted Zn-dependent protease
MIQKVLGSFLALTLLFQGCATSGANKNSGGRIFSDSQETAIGEQIHSQIVSTFYVYTEPQMVAYLNRIGSSLAKNAKRQDLPYRLTLLYNEKIYATSAPGGHIYLTTGMVNFLENEAQLAAVIAHEIGELQYRDPRLSRSQKALEGITQVGAAVAPAFGQIGMLAVLGLILVNAAVDAAEKTLEERLLESDHRAMSYLLKAGYDPQALLDVFYKFLKADSKDIPYFYDYYQARPITEHRVLTVQQEFLKLPLQNKSLTTNPKGFQEMTKGIKEIYKR